MSTKKIGRPAVTKSAAEQSYVRDALKAAAVAQGTIAEVAGVNPSNISKFMAGKQANLSDAAIEALYSAGLIERPDAAALQNSQSAAAPLETWAGELKTVAQVAEEKGVTPNTVRNWAKAGKVRYMRRGRRILIVVDDQLAAIEPSEKAVLRARVMELEAENERLRQQVETMQLEFAWGETKEDAAANEPSARSLPEEEEIEEFEEIAVATIEPGSVEATKCETCGISLCSSADFAARKCFFCRSKATTEPEIIDARVVWRNAAGVNR